MTKLWSVFRNFDSLPAEKQGVLVNMSYNLGLQRLGGFKNLINAVRFEDCGQPRQGARQGDGRESVRVKQREVLTPAIVPVR
jgi:hypothetical protein